MTATSSSNGHNRVSLVPYGLNEQHPNNYKRYRGRDVGEPR